MSRHTVEARKGAGYKLERGPNIQGHQHPRSSGGRFLGRLDR